MLTVAESAIVSLIEEIWLQADNAVCATTFLSGVEL